MYKLITQLQRVPTSTGAGGVYPFDLKLIDACARKAKYADENGKFDYSLCRVVGSEFNKRIWVPRNMVTALGDDLRERGTDVSFTSQFTPRNSEQSRCIAEVVSLLRQEESFVFEAPTGFGKTWCAADVIAKVGKKTIIVVTKEDILDQWVAAFEAILGIHPGKGIGFIQGDKVLTAKQDVVIAMVHSIAKEARYPEHIFRDFGLAIWDECIAEDSKILMGDGETQVPIQVLADGFLHRNKKPSVMSYNLRNGRWEPRQITNAWVSGVKKIVEVTTDDGKTLRCTGDHLLLTSNRGWVAAINLTPSDDLVIY